MLENREIIHFKSEEEWLILRKEDYTSTTVAGLFGLSPYVSRFEIYHAKANNIHVPFEPTERTEKGKRLQDAIAQEVGIMLSMEVKPMNFYVRIPATKIGSSFDYQINHPEYGWIPLEIKAVDFFQHKEKWVEDQAPDHIELQLQHQLETANAEAGMIAAATGIYDIHTYLRKRDKEVGAAIHKFVGQMEEDIAKGNSPSPDIGSDLEVVKLLFPNADGDLDATKDNEMSAMLNKYKRLKTDAGEIEKELEKLKAQIHYKAGDKGKVFTNEHIATVGWIKDSPGLLITHHMVGQYVGARKGYRQLLVKGVK